MIRSNSLRAPRNTRTPSDSAAGRFVESLEMRRLFSSIAGTVFTDTNGNGVRDAGELGLPGTGTAQSWAVYLDKNANGIRDAGEVSQTVGASGQYSFTGLTPGYYSVAAVPQTGFKQTTQPAAGLIPLAAAHDYQLKGTLADAKGGPSLVSGGGTIGSTGYTFAAMQGPHVSGLVTATGSYSIQIVFKLNAVDGYRKLIDFKNRTVDAGIYDLNGALTFYGGTGAGPANTIKAGTAVDLLITRDAASKTFTAYINGVMQFSNVDTNGLATFTGPGGIINILQDDLATNHEYGAGVLTNVRTFNTALTATQAVTLHKGGTASHAGEWLVNLANNQAVTAKDFGFQKLGSTHIKGIVFQDTNGDKTREAAEPAIANAVVFIDTNKNGKLDTGEKSLKTAADGSYDFAGLAAGSYSVGVVPQTGFKITTPAAPGIFLTNDYELKSNLKEAQGGTALTTGGGTATSGGYQFAAKQGLSLASGFSTAGYTIEMRLKITDVSGYRKLIDFKNRTVDAGLYINSGVLTFYGTAQGTKATVVNNTTVDIVLTRNATTKQVTAYVNGVQQFTFTDTAGVAVFTSKAWFLQDDLGTDHEYAAGLLSRLRLYNGPLTAAQVTSLHGTGTPPLGVHDYSITLAAGATQQNVNFGEQKIV